MALQSLRCLRGPNESNSTERRDFSRVADWVRRTRTIFCPHGEPATGSTLLLKNCISTWQVNRQQAPSSGQASTGYAESLDKLKVCINDGVFGLNLISHDSAPRAAGIVQIM